MFYMEDMQKYMQIHAKIKHLWNMVSMLRKIRTRKKHTKYHTMFYMEDM